MRYAILTAVSSKVQAAPDKISLSEQERRCRQAASLRNWQETAGPFIIPGQHRTGYVNLSDAERDLPALSAMLDSAERREFDILVIYDFSRLRDLISIVSISLADYSIQIYAVSQPVEPMPPEQFDPTLADASYYVQQSSHMTSRAEINALRRRFKLGMPGRVSEKRLHPLGTLPYGYRKPPGHELNRGAIPEQDPAQSAIVLRIKDLFLAGASLPQIAAVLNAENLPASRGDHWHPDTLRYILKNPYYAGLVQFGKRRRQNNARIAHTTIVFNPPEKITTAVGLHPPLWDQDTYTAILAELARRGRANTGKASSRFSRLLYCPCGKVCWVGYVTWPGHPAGDNNRYYICSTSRGNHAPQPGHIRFPERDLLPRIIDAMISDLQNVENILLPAAQPVTPSPTAAAELLELQARQDRLTDALELGRLDSAVYATRTAALKERIQALTDQVADQERQAQKQAARHARLRDFAAGIDTLPAYIITADPQTVNTTLRAYINQIHIAHTGEISIDWA